MSIFEENFGIARSIAIPMKGGYVTPDATIPDQPGVGNCPNIVNTYSYREYWSSGFGLWINGTGGNRTWTRDASGTGSSSTGPNGGAYGSYYLYTEASGYTNTMHEVTSPCFDLTGAIAGNFRFAWNMYGSNQGTMWLEVAIVTTGEVGTWNTLFTRSGDYGSPTWIYEDNDLASYVGQYIKFRFRGLTGNGYRSDMAVDDITVSITEGSIYGSAKRKDSAMLIPLKKTIRL